MKSSVQFMLLALALGLCSSASPQAKKDDSARDKRGFTRYQQAVHVGHGFGGFSAEHGHGFAGALGAKSAVFALEASKAATQKKIEANQIANAAHAAQAAALRESALTGKTAAAVNAADKTYNIAISLSHKLSDALSEAENLSAESWKSLQAAKEVEAAQSAMVYEAQRAADALSQEQFRSLKELQAAQTAALKAQALASKAHSVY